MVNQTLVFQIKFCGNSPALRVAAKRWASFKKTLKMKELFEKYLLQIAQIGGNSRQLIFEKPATLKEIEEVESKLTCKIPSDFKDNLLNLSSHCEFKWFLPDNFTLPDQLRQIFCGEIHWSLDLIIAFNESKDDWINEAFPNIEDKYDKAWYNKFVFQEVGNGDYILIDLSTDNLGKIIYLSHDDGEGHGFVMANSFTELLTNWTKLGCVGGEDWQWLPFCKDQTSGIDPNCENAILWYETIGVR